ncbi:hypothetical protein NYR54_18665 [Chelativorans sp. SCAU2101]|uniref:Virulence factor MVIN family protein n=1 Tax=Chelativorans petroleitrophicus TaxID=2975484 RepID=A0A9X3BAN0_9HYPH|nr:lipid II flippase MurJ [Chelativorans petroleitrophicus]MCT8992271.1 hypothetical protein [Chelativorans petroleitrophicus]
MKLIARLHANHKLIASGMVTVGALVLAAKVIGAAKEVAVAWRYGVSGVVDAYLLALAITTWLPVILSSVSLVVFVPRLAGLEGQEREKYISQLNGLYLALAVFSTILTYFAGPPIAGWIAGGLDAKTIALARSAVMWLSPTAGFIMVTGYLALRLQSRRKFAYTFFEATPSALILLFVLLLASTAAIEPLLWGTVAGFGLQMLILMSLTQKADKSLAGITLPDFRSPAWQAAGAALGVMLINQLLSGLSTPIDRFSAASMGDNVISTLGYADRIIALATSLGATVVARATLPVFSIGVINKKYEDIARQARIWSFIMFLLGIFASLIIWNASNIIVKLLFERGAFHAQDTDRVSSVLRVACLYLPFYFSSIVLVQWFSARRRLKNVLLMTSVGILAKIGTIIILYDIGIYAIAASSVSYYAFSFLIGGFLAFRRSPNVKAMVSGQ